MAKEYLADSIKEHFRLSDDEIYAVLNRFEDKRIKKKTNLLSIGEVAREAHFIIQGCMRVYYEKDATEISAFFFTEAMFTGACESFIGQKPSRHYIQTIEDCHVLSISYQDLQELYVEYPWVNTFFRKIIEERFETIHNLFTTQLLDSPEERYLNLLNTNPGLFNRVPQHQIATYLGITPVSLSRIRNRVKKN